MRSWILAAVLSTAMGTACTPKIDSTNEEEMKTSVEAMTKSMSDEEKAAFKDAVLVVMMSELSFTDLAKGDEAGDEAAQKGLAKLHGKSAKQVLAMAEEIRGAREREKKKREAEQQAKQVEQAKQELANLAAKKSASDDALEKLKAFQVASSRFLKQPQRFGRPKSIIALSVKNETGHAISRVYFQGTYATPGRSVPWHTGEFNYSIPGGLEPGENADWGLEPNMFSDWGTLEARDDAVLSVDVIQLDGVDQKPLLQASYTESDANRARALQEQLATLGVE